MKKSVIVFLSILLAAALIAVTGCSKTTTRINNRNYHHQSNREYNYHINPGDFHYFPDTEHRYTFVI